MSDLDADFARWFSGQRRLARLSLREVARRATDAGLPLQATQVSRVESGERGVKLSEADILARAVGSSARDFMATTMGPQDVFQWDVNGLLHDVHTATQRTVEDMMTLDLRRAEATRFLERLDDLVEDGEVNSQDAAVQEARSSLEDLVAQTWHGLVVREVKRRLTQPDLDGRGNPDAAALRAMSWPEGMRSQ